MYRLHGPPMLVDKTNFDVVLYNPTNFYQSEETSSYWSVKRISVFFLLFIGQPVTHLQNHSVLPYTDQYRRYCTGHAQLQ